MLTPIHGAVFDWNVDPQKDAIIFFCFQKLRIPKWSAPRHWSARLWSEHFWDVFCRHDVCIGKSKTDIAPTVWKYFRVQYFIGLQWSRRTQWITPKTEDLALCLQRSRRKKKKTFFFRLLRHRKKKGWFPELHMLSKKWITSTWPLLTSV